MIRTLTTFIFVVMLSVLITPVVALAQGIDSSSTPVSQKGESQNEVDTPGDWYLPETVAKQAGAVSCFDYYTFGSVQVDASPLLVTDIVPGSPITFTGKIKNANPYPIVDGQVYVKIFKKDQPDEMALKLNGYPIIDFFLAKDKVFLAAQSEQDITFDWVVPQSAEGEYQAAFYFTSAHRYNLLGLSFTDDVTGNKSNFSVAGQSHQKKPVVFDKNNIALNETAFHPTTFLPHFSRDESVTAYTTLINPESEEKTVEVTWVTSRWDGILTTNENKREVFTIALKPGENRKFSYTVPQVETAVTFVQAIVKDGDATSIVHIRFIRDGYEETRINFPSILSYPLVKDEENTLFSCVHATNTPIISDNTLTLTVKDESGVVVHTYTYTGSVTGEMMGVKDTFRPSRSLTNFSLTARLEHQGALVDEVVMQYDCANIDPSFCVKPIASGPNMLTPPWSKMLWPIIVFVLALLAGGIIWMRLRKGSGTSGIPPSVPSALIIIMLLFSGSFFFPKMVEASSVSWTSGVVPNLSGWIWGSRCDLTIPGNKYLCDYPDPDIQEQAVRYDTWIRAGSMSNITTSVSYAATVKNNTTNITGDTVAVTVGDSITLLPTAKSGTDISFSNSGYSNDTPYGNWSNGTGVTCNASTLVGSVSAGGGAATAYYWGYVALNIAPQTPTITANGTATLSCDTSAIPTCTVTGAGTINATITWPATTGYFNYAYTKTGYVLPPSADYLPNHDCQGAGQMTASSDPLSPYVLAVPEKSISFYLTASAPPQIDVHF